MRSVNPAILILLGLVLATTAFAGITPWSDHSGDVPGQDDTRLTLFVAIAVPSGDFGETNSYQAGFARTGGGGGLDVTSHYRPGIEGGVLAWADVHPVNVGVIEHDLRTALEAFGYPSDSLRLSASAWNSFWTLAKLGYSPKTGRDWRVFGDVYGGALFVRTPAIKALSTPAGVTVTSVRHFWMGFATGVGGGLCWRDRLSVGLLYLSGSLRRDDTDLRQTSHPRVQALHATLGYSFKL
jgi:hypothetical protein